MARINLDTEELYEHGHAIGFVIGAFIRGLIDGMEEFESVTAELEEKNRVEAEGLQRIKRDNGDCADCWCDTCDKLNECEQLLEGTAPDGIRPFPCVGCKDGMRFKPSENEKCRGYEERGEE